MVTAVAGAEQRFKELGLALPPVPTPFGAYVEAVQSGNLLFISGTLPAIGHEAKFVGRVGEEFGIEEGRRAAHLAALNAVAIAKHHLGSLDRVIRVVRLGVSIATAPSFRDHPKVADGASELLASIFGQDKLSTRLVLGVASVPLGMAIELELIFEIAV
jgi:enamine deaminase RidA (YjgF/YER057c/UK114 family)